MFNVNKLPVLAALLPLKLISTTLPVKPTVEEDNAKSLPEVKLFPVILKALEVVAPNENAVVYVV